MNTVTYADDGITIQLEDRKIKICTSVIATLKKHVYDKAEAGGVLIGRENIENHNLIIEITTEPYRADVRKRTSFLRKDKKHIQIFKQLNIANNNIYAYIGEWHTHSQATPYYSWKDFNNWTKIAKEFPNDQCQFHIITGYEIWRLWKFDSHKKCILVAEMRVSDKYEKDN